MNARAKRPLLALAAAVPAAVLAAVSAGSGQVVEVDNYDADVASSYVNLDQCQGADINLEWNIGSGAQPVANDRYKIYSSNTAPSVPTGGTFKLCPEQNSTGGTGGDVFADKVADVGATRDVQTLGVPAMTSGATPGVVDSAALTCDEGSELKPLYVCAHWTDGADAKKGSASGKFIIQVKRPNAPASVTATPGDGALNVSWPAATTDGGAAEARSYRVIVKLAGFEVGRRDDLTATSVRISGLLNDEPYDIEVFGLSVAKNPSLTPAVGAGTPKEVADFWDLYTAGGQEVGGCAAGAAGPLALLGVALLAVLRRRK